MIRTFIFFAVALLAAACEREADDAAGQDLAAGEEMVEVTQTYSGAHAYELVCARCHEEGIDGAPRTGDPEAWEGRSQLWEAVLFEHAKKGYNDMPAKGGEEWLEDDMVEKAAEHMLRQINQRSPPD